MPQPQLAPSCISGSFASGKKEEKIVQFQAGQLRLRLGASDLQLRAGGRWLVHLSGSCHPSAAICLVPPARSAAAQTKRCVSVCQCSIEPHLSGLCAVRRALASQKNYRLLPQHMSARFFRFVFFFLFFSQFLLPPLQLAKIYTRRV